MVGADEPTRHCGPMIDKTKFQAGLHALGLAFGKQITADVLRVFDGVLSAKLDTAQWEQAVRRCLEVETFFPPPSVLLRYGLFDTVPAATLAFEAYERIQVRFENGGTHYGTIKAELGRAAADAFVAAGGHRAFSWCEPDNEPFRWKAFKEAFVEQVDSEPSLALPAGNDSQAISAAEAKRLMAGLE